MLFVVLVGDLSLEKIAIEQKYKELRLAHVKLKGKYKG